jgi:hypothetical protein
VVLVGRIDFAFDRRPARGIWRNETSVKPLKRLDPAKKCNFAANNFKDLRTPCEAIGFAGRNEARAPEVLPATRRESGGARRFLFFSAISLWKGPIRKSKRKQMKAFCLVLFSLASAPLALWLSKPTPSASDRKLATHFEASPRQLAAEAE